MRSRFILLLHFLALRDHWYPADPKKKAKVHSALDWHHSNLRRGSEDAAIAAPAIHGGKRNLVNGKSAGGDWNARDIVAESQDVVEVTMSAASMAMSVPARLPFLHLLPLVFGESLIPSPTIATGIYEKQEFEISLGNGHQNHVFEITINILEVVNQIGTREPRKLWVTCGVSEYLDRVTSESEDTLRSTDSGPTITVVGVAAEEHMGDDDHYGDAKCRSELESYPSKKVSEILGSHSTFNEKPSERVEKERAMT
ncbi:hypothetical protein Dimus_036625 [Dionaea muscipula]